MCYRDTLWPEDISADRTKHQMEGPALVTLLDHCALGDGGQPHHINNLFN